MTKTSRDDERPGRHRERKGCSSGEDDDVSRVELGGYSSLGSYDQGDDKERDVGEEDGAGEMSLGSLVRSTVAMEGDEVGDEDEDLGRE